MKQSPLLLTFEYMSSAVSRVTRRWTSSAHQNSAHHEHIPEIPPYRRPVIPPNRPLAFFLSGTLVVAAFSVTGFFLYPAVPHHIPDDRTDNKPVHYPTTIDEATVDVKRPADK